MSGHRAGGDYRAAPERAPVRPCDRFRSCGGRRYACGVDSRDDRLTTVAQSLQPGEHAQEPVLAVEAVTCVRGQPSRQRHIGHASRRRCAAFTLIEFAVALAIAGLLAVMAFPAFYEWIGAYELANVAKHLAETMTRARTEAVRRGHRVNLCKSIDGQQCADHGNWEVGLVMFVDANHNGRIDVDEKILEVEGPAPRGISVSGNRPVDDYVSYMELGHARMLNGALQMGTFVVCRRGQRALHVVLANTGRVRIERTSDICN